MIRTNKIGVEYIVKHNGSEFHITIEDNPAKFELYKKLGLDVFKKVNNTPIKPLKKKPVKKNATTKSN